MVTQLDVSGLEFPPGEMTSQWVSSTDFHWYINKSNNQNNGSFTTQELSDMEISQWSIRCHVGVNEDPTVASLKGLFIYLMIQEGDRGSQAKYHSLIGRVIYLNLKKKKYH